jgi:hypothetical protein
VDNSLRSGHDLHRRYPPPLHPDFYRAATDRDGQSVGGLLPADWSPANALSFMDDRRDRHAELSDTERVAVLHGAAVSLLPRLTTHPRLTDDATTDRR